MSIKMFKEEEETGKSKPARCTKNWPITKPN